MALARYEYMISVENSMASVMMVVYVGRGVDVLDLRKLVATITCQETKLIVYAKVCELKEG